MFGVVLDMKETCTLLCSCNKPSSHQPIQHLLACSLVTVEIEVSKPLFLTSYYLSNAIVS